MTASQAGSGAEEQGASASLADGRPGAVPDAGRATNGRPALVTFADIAAAIQAEYAGIDALSRRDLILLRLAAEKALEARDYVEMARVHRMIAKKETILRVQRVAQQRADAGRSQSLRAKLSQRYAAGSAP